MVVLRAVKALGLSEFLLARSTLLLLAYAVLGVAFFFLC